MSGRSTKRVVKSTEATLQKLEEEAKEFTKKAIKKPEVETDKTITPRQAIAATILAGLLAKATGNVRQGDLLKEAFDWADRILEVD